MHPKNKAHTSTLGASLLFTPFPFVGTSFVIVLCLLNLNFFCRSERMPPLSPYFFFCSFLNCQERTCKQTVAGMERDRDKARRQRETDTENDGRTGEAKRLPVTAIPAIARCLCCLLLLLSFPFQPKSTIFQGYTGIG